LRYLSQAYKTLLQTVPEAARTDEVDDLIEQLRAMVRHVDSSLLDEWESLRETPVGKLPAILPPEEKDFAHDPKALAVRLRGELHRLVASLAHKRWDEALERVRASELDATELAAALQPYFAEHPKIDSTPRARRPSLTRIAPGPEPRSFVAQQSLLDPALPEDECEWMVECTVDLNQPPNDQPLIRLRQITGG
jgi:hypothetical protein